MYQPTDSPPCAPRIRFSRAPMSSSASSQPTRSKLAARGPPQRVQHAVGVVLDLGHRDPLRAGEPADSGWSGSGRSLSRAVLDRRDHAAERLADPAVGDALVRCQAISLWTGTIVPVGLAGGAPSVEVLPDRLAGEAPAAVRTACDAGSPTDALHRSAALALPLRRRDAAHDVVGQRIADRIIPRARRRLAARRASARRGPPCSRRLARRSAPRHERQSQPDRAAPRSSPRRALRRRS